MNLEGITLHLLTNTLKQELEGSKIYRVFMPTHQSLLLMLKRERDTVALLCDLGGGGPALYIPNKLPENPEVPPAFCMLLRKHLEEGRITSIQQQDLDRIITLEIDMLGQGSKIITKKLIFELTGKNSNIILTQMQDNPNSQESQQKPSLELILDCLKHIGASQSSFRTVLPGKEYVAPPAQDGLNILNVSPAEIVAKANSTPAATFLPALISTTTGIGKVTATELLLQADILPNTVRLEAPEAEALAKAIAKLQKLPANSPVYALISRTNQVKTLLPTEPIALGEGMRTEAFQDINAAINYAMSLQPIQLPQHEALQKIVVAETSKLSKKHKALEKDLDHALDCEKQREIADTLMAYIYQIEKGATSVKLNNLYDGEPLTIQLSPMLTPLENAQAYYKRYNKYKRAQNELQTQLENTEEMLTYLGSLAASLLTATTKNEIAEIRQEMIAAGLIKEVSKKKKFNLPKSNPLHIKLNEDTELYVGKNNKQNDYVTFSIGGPRDYWFHTKDIPGSHVILKTTLPELREEDLAIALQIAAYFSQARNSSNIPIDCVPRRFVKKPSGSKPGFVIFTNQVTHYINPNPQIINKYIKP